MIFKISSFLTLALAALSSLDGVTAIPMSESVDGGQLSRRDGGFFTRIGVYQPYTIAL